MDRTADLRADYERLGVVLATEVDGSKAAALVRERRMIGELLDALEATEEASVVDQLESRRRAKTGDTRPSTRRRKSG